MTDTHDARFGSLAHLCATLALGCALLVSACSGSDEAARVDNAIDREVFIQAYIDLRVAALESESQELSDEARTEVLTRHSITADDLMNFGEVHGRHPDFMRDVWNEVETRMDNLMPEAR